MYKTMRGKSPCKWWLASQSFLCLYSALLDFGVIPDFVNASPKLGFVSQNIKKWLDSTHNKIIG